MFPPPDPAFGSRQTLATVACFTALTLVQLWPLPAQLTTATPAHPDAILNAGLFGLLARQFVTAPWQLFDVNMYFPFRHALAAVDHQISSTLLVLPVTWVFGPLAGHNLFVLLSFVAAGVGTSRLAQALGGSWAGGLLAGAIFAFSPFRLSHVVHAHVLAGCWLPFLLLSAYRALAAPTWRALLATLAWWLVLVMASWYLAVIAGVALATLVFIHVLGHPADLKRLLPRAAAVAVLVVVIAAPAAWPYLTLTREFDPVVRTAWRVPPSAVTETTSLREQATGGVATMGALWDNSATAESYVATGRDTRAPWLKPLSQWGSLEAVFFPGLIAIACAWVGGWRWARETLGRRWLLACGVVALAIGLGVESAFRAGADTRWTQGLRATHLVVWAPLVLVVWAAVRVRRDTMPAAGGAASMVPLLAIGIVGWVISLGPEVRAFGVSLGAGLYPIDLPPFSLLRSPARFGILSVLSLAIFAGLGLTWIASRVRSAGVRALVAAGALAGVTVESAVAPLPLFAAHAIDTSLYTHLATRPPGPLVEFPIHDNLWPLVRERHHGLPLVNGSGAREPTPYAGLHGGNDLTPEMVEHIRTYFHARYALVDFSLYDAQRRAVVEGNIRDNGDGLVLIAEAGLARLYEIRERSRGTRITRVFQPKQLAGRKGVFIEAALDDAGSADITRRLVAWIDGARALEWEAARVTPRNLLYVPLPPAVTGPMALELVSDYSVTATRGSSSPDRFVATLPVADIAVHAASDRTRIRINGDEWVGEKGYTVLVLDRDGRATDVRNFNTSWSAGDAASLAAHLRAVPSGRAVVIASTYDVSRELSAEAVDALRRVGLSADLRNQYGWAHCGIGVADAPPGTAIEATGQTVADCRVGQPRDTALTVTRVQPF